MRTTACDACGRTEPDVYCQYSRRKRWAWFRYDYDSQGGSYSKLDLCKGCWDGFVEFMKIKVKKRKGVK